LDFREASFIFQHGSQPDDFLMAHILAMAALAKGDQESRWIAAATLDRYLHSIGQKQVFGTQYRSGGGEPMTQEPFNRALVAVPLRETLCVPNDHIQQIMLDAFRQNRHPIYRSFNRRGPAKSSRLDENGDLLTVGRDRRSSRRKHESTAPAFDHSVAPSRISDKRF
jgi:hypothetical protein